MSEADYSKQAATALKLIRQKGRIVTFTRPNVTLDHVTGVITGEAATASPPAVVLPYGGNPNASLPEELRRAKLRKLILPAEGFAFTPQSNDQFDLGGVDGDGWTVWSSTPLAPAGTAIIHTAIIYK